MQRLRDVPTAGLSTYEVNDRFIAGQPRPSVRPDQRARDDDGARREHDSADDGGPSLIWLIPGLALLAAAAALLLARRPRRHGPRRRQSHHPRRRWPRHSRSSDDDRRLRGEGSPARRSGRPRRRRHVSADAGSGGRGSRSSSAGCGSCHTFEPAAPAADRPDLALSLRRKSRDYVLESMVLPNQEATNAYSIGGMPIGYTQRIAPHDLRPLVAFLMAGAGRPALAAHNR